MSLIRQLWLAVVIVMTLAFGGSFVISTLAARHYFKQQLFVKNVDNATSLALSMSQMAKDPVTIELLMSAQFDAGHYRLIRLTDPNGKVIVERHNDAPVQGVPALFVRAIPLDIAPGVAQVQDGWHQYGTLTLMSHDQYAYAELWNGTVWLLGWFAMAALGVGLIGTALLRVILRPLDAVVSQAEAIGERRFITHPEPATPELRQLVRTMNGLAQRVQQMLEEESRRVESLRRQAQTDPVTGLRNRETFVASLEDALSRNDLGATGVLVILRVTGLTELNRAIGREAADQVLRRVGECLTHAVAASATPCLVARLGSADFAVLAPGETDALETGELVRAQAQLALDRPDAVDTAVIRAGSSTYHGGETRAVVLARVDGALAKAEQTEQTLVTALGAESDPALPTDLAGWRTSLESAIRGKAVKLGRYPVTTIDGSLLHYESPARLRILQEWVPAARFIAWAARLGLMPRLDALMVDTAIAQLALHRVPLGVNVSPETICDPNFTSLLVRQLRNAPDIAELLWLEVPEYGALRHLDAFRRFCAAAKPLGCKLGLKHAGPQFARISDMHDLGLDYLKIDGAIVQAIHDGTSHEVFLRSLCTVAHAVGLRTIAAGVNNAGDLQLLQEMGIDAFTGPAVSETDH